MPAFTCKRCETTYVRDESPVTCILCCSRGYSEPFEARDSNGWDAPSGFPDAKAFHVKLVTLACNAADANGPFDLNVRHEMAQASQIYAAALAIIAQRERQIAAMGGYREARDRCIHGRGMDVYCKDCAVCAPFKSQRIVEA